MKAISILSDNHSIKIWVSVEEYKPSSIYTADRFSQTQGEADSFVHRDNLCIIFLCNRNNTLDRAILWSFISPCYVAQTTV